jgi:hypothetical protein
MYFELQIENPWGGLSPKFPDLLEDQLHQIETQLPSNVLTEIPLPKEDYICITEEETEAQT